MGDGIPAPVNPPPKPKPKPPPAACGLRELAAHLDELRVPSDREEGTRPQLTVPRVGTVTPVTGGYEFRGELFCLVGELANRIAVHWAEQAYQETASTAPTTTAAKLGAQHRRIRA